MRLRFLSTVSLTVGLAYGVAVGYLISQLDVFKDPLSYPVAAALILVNVSAVALASAASLKLSEGTGKVGALISTLILAVVVVLPVSKLTLDYSLNLDVEYTYVKVKAGLNLLEFRFLGGSIFLTAILAPLIVLASDPRIYRRIGGDGRPHFYVKSKLLSLLRVFLQDRGRLIGVTYDNGFTLQPTILAGRDEILFNDKVRMIPYGALWMAVKACLALTLALTLGYGLTLKLNAVLYGIRAYGWTVLELASSIASTFAERMSLAYTTPAGYPVNQAFTLEFYGLAYYLILIISLLWIARLVMSAVGNVAAIVASRQLNTPSPTSTVGVAVDLVGAAGLGLLSVYAKTPLQVFDRATPYYTVTLGLLLAATFLLALTLKIASRRRRVYDRVRSYLRRTTDLRRARRRLPILALTLLLIVSPTIYAKLTVEPYMQGRAYEYLWIPAYKPTIEFTRWAYSVDTLKEAYVEDVSVNDTGILERIRVFTPEAAKLNLKPYVGVNWMSIEEAVIDIVYFRGREYWLALLTPVRPPYYGDVDVWRANHLILTHSEKILALDSTSAEIVDPEKLFNLTGTPSFYYGEGGLWREVDEIYIGIPTFQEIHLPDYRGPPGYQGEPDYVYKGFWRYWRFFWEVKWDFAQGAYGDVKTLVYRDCKERISRILLPYMQTTGNGHLVFDGRGGVYLLYWVWTSWPPPHDYLDWPEHEFEGITRLIGFILVNLYDGSIDGYLLENYRRDYITEFYRHIYRRWDKPIPEWLKPQLKYPEELFESQIECYNWYFQDDFSKWQSNQFYDFTRDERGEVFEDVRYIVLKFKGEETWCAVRLVEWYMSPSKNLAGMYIAPSGRRLGQIYFLNLGNRTVIGPWTALSAVHNDPDVKRELTLHTNWKHSNILLYALSDRLVYLIPFYAEEKDLALPAMVVAVDAETQDVGFYVALNPKNPAEIRLAGLKAVQTLGYTSSTLTEEEKKANIERLLEGLGFTVVEAEALYPDVKVSEGAVTYRVEEDIGKVQEALENLLQNLRLNRRIYLWVEDSKVNVGYLASFSGVLELHYISIEF